MHTLDLAFRAAPRRTCRIRVGRGALGLLVEEAAAAPPGRPLVLVSDARVAPLWGDALAARLERAGLAVERLTFPAGEGSKTRETKAALEDGLARVGAGRDAAIVALGGGVTGDLAGFLAATWHRGLPLIQAPTSLLAMADAAIGGKTAVNLPGGKNLVGAFWQPLAVYADVETLATLPRARLVEGLAEVVKAAVVGDARLFAWLERSSAALLAGDPAALEHAVAASVAIKARVVQRDERESGRRAVLNFGHTVAHALELASGFALAHGEAVAIGMVVEGALAVEATGFPARQLQRLERLLRALELPVRPPPEPDHDLLLEAARRDKKARRGQARYALPLRIGRMPPGGAVARAVGEAQLSAALREAARGSR